MQEWTNEGSVPFYSEKDKVKKVVIEEGVTSIGFCTFRTYTNIESVELPESLEIIGQSAFDRCSSLTSINIPKSVKEIKDYAFWKCTSLKEINMTKGLETIGAYAFGNTAVETVVLPEGLKTIKEYAFAESQKIKSIEIPASVEKIEGAAFYSIGYNCTSITIDSKNQNYISEEGIIYTKDKTRLVHYLISREDTTYKIPESVQIIDKGAFAWCNRLTEITIPSNVKEIGSAAFRGDKKLKTVKIENGVEKIIGNAFSECTELESIEIPSSVTSMEASVFENCNKLTIYGEKGSYAETYANNNNIKFQDIENADTTKPAITSIVGEKDEQGNYTVVIKVTDESEIKKVTVNETEITQRDETGRYVFKPTANGKYTVTVTFKDGTTESKEYEETRFTNSDDEDNNGGNGNIGNNNNGSNNNGSNNSGNSGSSSNGVSNNSSNLSGNGTTSGESGTKGNSISTSTALTTLPKTGTKLGALYAIIASGISAVFAWFKSKKIK